MNKLKLKRLIYRIQHDYLTLNNVVIAAAILIAMSWAWGSIESMQKNYELQRSIDNKRQQVEIEKLQVALLEYESKYYQSEEYQELTIRQRTGKVYLAKNSSSPNLSKAPRLPKNLRRARSEQIATSSNG